MAKESELIWKIYKRTRDTIKSKTIKMEMEINGGQWIRAKKQYFNRKSMEEWFGFWIWSYCVVNHGDIPLCIC